MAATADPASFPASSPAVPPLVLAIQSQVVYGHVGNSAALFPMEALGVRVAAVPTTLLSNHPHYPTMRGRVLEADLVADLLLGVEERGLPERAFGLVTGYLGSRAVAEVVADFVERVKPRCPGLFYLCDPVIGDLDAGVYVGEGVAEVVLNRLVPLADLITPNAFEQALLAGMRPDADGARLWSRSDFPDPMVPPETLAALAACRAGLAARHAEGRAPAMIATGCRLRDTAEECLDTVLIDAQGTERRACPFVPVAAVGTGDLFAGQCLARMACGADMRTAMHAAVDCVSTVLERTHAERSRELAIIT